MFQSPFVTYAQNGEDVLLWRALKQVQRGFYIDVGAQDPVNDSVTKAFYERGWQGINIEPVQRWYDRLVQDRPHDVNLRVAVGNQPGTTRLFEVEGSGLSTSDPDFAHRHAAEGHVLHEQIVECVTLDRICTDNNVGTVHFLKIDCEGAEKAALEGIALSNVRPWIVLVEATEPNSTKPTWDQWEHLLTGRGYRFVFFDGLNRFYLADEHNNLAAAFDAPVNVFDSAQRLSEVDAQRQITVLRGEIEGLKGAAVVAKLQAELATVTAQRAAAEVERDAATTERNAIAAERDAATAECNAIAAERNAATAERDAVVVERNAVTAERDAVKSDRDVLRAHLSVARDEAAVQQLELGRLHANQVALLSSHSWRITAPLRTCSRAGQWAFHRLHRMVYLALRPFARAARPMLQRLARWGMARRLVTGIFGRHSRLVNTGRLFLVGSPMPPRVIEDMVSPDVTPEDPSLSARGREVLSALEGMRTRAEGESQGASRT